MAAGWLAPRSLTKTMISQQDIFKAKNWDLGLIKRNDIPTDKGVYCYLDQWTESIAYVGSAVGVKGLRGRIWSQHLNPNYLENRKELFSQQDKGQIDKKVIRQGKIVIEKSAFRKNIARNHDLIPGEECVNFILSKFILIFFPLKFEKKKIHEIEKEMILEFTPIHNIRKF